MTYWPYLKPEEIPELDDVKRQFREAVKARRRIWDRCRKRALAAKKARREDQ